MVECKFSYLNKQKLLTHTEITYANTNIPNLIATQSDQDTMVRQKILFLKALLLPKNKAGKLLGAFVAGACAFTILPSQGLAADNIQEITVGLTCANVGREIGKWDELEGTGGFLDAPWYTGQKEATSWQEDETNKAAMITSQINS